MPLEIEVLGEPIGKQDQYIAAYGGITRHDLPTRRRGGAWSGCDLRDEVIDELENKLVIFYSGVERAASSVLVQQGERIIENTDAAVERMHRIKALGPRDEEDPARRRHRRVRRAAARALDATSASSPPNMTDSVIDEHYEAARKAGAIGGKLMGAGGGGFFMFYAARPSGARCTRR